MISNKSGSYKWVVLGISFMLMLTFAISLQSLPPIMDKIAEDISFSNSQAGMLMGIYAIPGIFLPFLVAFLANKYNKKSIILIALLILILGLVTFSMSKSFTTLLTFRLVTGIGATTLVVLSPLLITMFFGGKNMGIAMGVFNAAVPFGTVVSANLFGALGERMTWQSIILAIVTFVGVVFLINFFLLSLPDEAEIEESGNLPNESLGELSSNISLWLLALIWILGNALLLAYVTFGPQYYQSLGMDTQRAGFLTSLIMLVPIFLSPIVGIIIDKTGWKKRLILIGSLIMGASFILLARNLGPTTLWAVTLGIGFSPIPVLVYSLLPDVVEPYQMGVGLAVVTAASNLGIAAGPSAFGFLLDSTGGNFNFGFMISALVSVVIILILGFLKANMGVKQEI